MPNIFTMPPWSEIKLVRGICYFRYCGELFTRILSIPLILISQFVPIFIKLLKSCGTKTMIRLNHYKIRNSYDLQKFLRSSKMRRADLQEGPIKVKLSKRSYCHSKPIHLITFFHKHSSFDLLLPLNHAR